MDWSDDGIVMRLPEAVEQIPIAVLQRELPASPRFEWSKFAQAYSQDHRYPTPPHPELLAALLTLLGHLDDTTAEIAGRMIARQLKKDLHGRPDIRRRAPRKARPSGGVPTPSAS